MMHVLDKLAKVRQELELIIGHGRYQATEYEKIVLDKEIDELKKLQNKMRTENYEHYV